jgi:DNA-binding transcriptional regulator LsrR (DeoR family)
MTRPYHCVGDDRRRLIVEWYIARQKLGTQKQLAERLGISEGRVQQIVAALRDEGLADFYIVARKK